jgi:glycosyltransferase involved in cell wall biosynthesis
MRILVVSSYPPRHCGIGAYARDQVARLRADGHEVTVLSPPDGDGDTRAEFVGGAAFRRAVRMGRRFDRVIVHFQPALYYRPRAAASKVATSASLWWLAARCRGLDLLVHEADRPVRWRPDYVLLRLAFRRAARVTFHTRAEREDLERSYRVRVRGEVMEHLAAPAAPPVAKEEARRLLGLDHPGPVFVCAGFLQPSKGFDRALSAFAQAGGGALYLVGSIRERTPENEAYVAELRERVAATPGASLVEGYLDDVGFDRWMAAADWVVLPYRKSWSSAVLARAHALGRPAMVARVGGLPEQAADVDVVFDDDEGLRRAMGHALQDASR